MFYGIFMGHNVLLLIIFATVKLLQRACLIYEKQRVKRVCRCADDSLELWNKNWPSPIEGVYETVNL